MAFTRTRIEGLDHAIRQFRRAPEVAKKHIGQAVQKTETVLADKTFDAAPRRTGMLRRAIQSKTVGLVARISIEDGHGGDRGPEVYWRFVEFGTSRMAAQPFIRPTAEAEQHPFIGRVEAAGVRVERELDA